MTIVCGGDRWGGLEAISEVATVNPWEAPSLEAATSISDSGSDSGNLEVAQITALPTTSSLNLPAPVKRRASMGKWTIQEDDLLRQVSHLGWMTCGWESKLLKRRSR